MNMTMMKLSPCARTLACLTPSTGITSRSRNVQHIQKSQKLRTACWKKGRRLVGNTEDEVASLFGWYLVTVPAGGGCKCERHFSRGFSAGLQLSQRKGLCSDFGSPERIKTVFGDDSDP